MPLFRSPQLQELARIYAFGLLLLLAGCKSSGTMEPHAGIWSTNCETVSVLDWKTDDRQLLTVNQNQIVVETASRPSTDKKELFLVRPHELGAGGAILDWPAFSKSTPIASIRFLAGGNAQLHWYGFLDTIANAKVWRHEPDFANREPIVSLTKCR